MKDASDDRPSSPSRGTTPDEAIGAAEGDEVDALFETLDELAALQNEMEASAETSEERARAARLDAVGARFSSDLVRVFSLKSAEIERLMHELDRVGGTWGPAIEQATRLG